MIIQVREAIEDTTAAIVTEYGLLSTTMSRIAEQTGIGRATLYKYFPDVETILASWHQRQIDAHLAHLRGLQGRVDAPHDKLRAVLRAYAHIRYQSRAHTDTNLTAVLHRGHEASEAERHLLDMLRELIVGAATAGAVRDDVPAAELASFCLHSVHGVTRLSSRRAVDRLVDVVLDGLSALNQTERPREGNL
jgi:AcrR family transcriptional regulator